MKPAQSAFNHQAEQAPLQGIVDYNGGKRWDKTATVVEMDKDLDVFCGGEIDHLDVTAEHVSIYLDDAAKINKLTVKATQSITIYVLGKSSIEGCDLECDHSIRLCYANEKDISSLNVEKKMTVVAESIVLDVPTQCKELHIDAEQLSWHVPLIVTDAGHINAKKMDLSDDLDVCGVDIHVFDHLLVNGRLFLDENCRWEVNGVLEVQPGSMIDSRVDLKGELEAGALGGQWSMHGCSISLDAQGSLFISGEFNDLDAFEAVAGERLVQNGFVEADSIAMRCPNGWIEQYGQMNAYTIIMDGRHGYQASTAVINADYLALFFDYSIGRYGSNRADLMEVAASFIYGFGGADYANVYQTSSVVSIEVGLLCANRIRRTSLVDFGKWFQMVNLQRLDAQTLNYIAMDVVRTVAAITMPPVLLRAASVEGLYYLSLGASACYHEYERMSQGSCRVHEMLRLMGDAWWMARTGYQCGQSAYHLMAHPAFGGAEAGVIPPTTHYNNRQCAGMLAQSVSRGLGAWTSDALISWEGVGFAFSRTDTHWLGTYLARGSVNQAIAVLIMTYELELLMSNADIESEEGDGMGVFEIDGNGVVVDAYHGSGAVYNLDESHGDLVELPHESNSGFDMTCSLYVNQKNGRMVIVFKGTGWCLNGLMDTFPMMFGWEPKSVKLARAAFKQKLNKAHSEIASISSQLGDNEGFSNLGEIILTGHSKGAMLATLFSAESGYVAIVFDNPGVYGLSPGDCINVLSIQSTPNMVNGHFACMVEVQYADQGLRFKFTKVLKDNGQSKYCKGTVVHLTNNGDETSTWYASHGLAYMGELMDQPGNQQPIAEGVQPLLGPIQSMQINKGEKVCAQEATSPAHEPLSEAVGSFGSLLEAVGLLSQRGLFSSQRSSVPGRMVAKHAM